MFLINLRSLTVHLDTLIDSYTPSTILPHLGLGWSQQIARALAGLKLQKQFHGDLKPGNVP